MKDAIQVPTTVEPVEASTEAPLLNRRDAAKFLSDRGYPTAYATLAKLAVVGGGPAFVRWGRRQVLYEQTELIAWAQQRAKRKRSTSDIGTAVGTESR